MIIPKSTLLTIGFRPLFLGAAAWSVLAMGVWIAALVGVVELPSCFDPITWHIHAMLFGVVMPAIGGFLLTAIPNWTGRPPVAGQLLGALLACWLAGRLVSLVSLVLPAWLVVTADLAFPVAFTAVAARELLAAGNRRNFPLLLPLALLATADLLMHIGVLGVALPIGLGWRLAVACILVLVSVIGGRIVPAFTRSWLTARGGAGVRPTDRIDRLGMGALHAGLFAWVVLPGAWPLGLLLLAGAALQLRQLVAWRGFATTDEPLLCVLHLGYLWLPVGVALLGLSMLTAAIPAAAALHALTAGAFGTMLLAVMTRVTLGHTGRALRADSSTAAIYALITTAAVLRVAAGWPGPATMNLLEAAAAAWIAAFALFLAHYGPMLVAPRLR